MEQSSQQLDSSTWLEREAHGDEGLLELLERQDELFSERFKTGDKHNAAKNQEMEYLKAKITATQRDKGIDPHVGPDYPRP